MGEEWEGEGVGGGWEGMGEEKHEREVRICEK